MFGYVRPSDDHLTAEDKQRFQAAYCGLCPQPGPEIRPGGPDDLKLRFSLSGHAAVPGAGVPHGALPGARAHPIRGCDALEPQPAFDAAADLSVILTWWQLTDGVADHGFFRGLPYRAALLLLRAGLSQGAGRGPASMRAPRRTWRSWHGWRRSNVPL